MRDQLDLALQGISKHLEGESRTAMHGRWVAESLKTVDDAEFWATMHLEFQSRAPLDAFQDALQGGPWVAVGPRKGRSTMFDLVTEIAAVTRQDLQDPLGCEKLQSDNHWGPIFGLIEQNPAVRSDWVRQVVEACVAVEGDWHRRIWNPCNQYPRRMLWLIAAKPSEDRQDNTHMSHTHNFHMRSMAQAAGAKQWHMRPVPFALLTCSRPLFGSFPLLLGP